MKLVLDFRLGIQVRIRSIKPASIYMGVRSSRLLYCAVRDARRS
ncbi:hypothetical protein [Microcoleus vaginatus]